MESNKDKEMHTVKEWAEITGLKLMNYDGYMDIYNKLSQAGTGDFYNDAVSRFREAGNLICTREGFESGLLGCSVEFPTIEELSRIADHIPRHAEFHIDLTLCDSTILNKEISTQERVNALKQILYKLEIKKNIRQKGIERYGKEQVTLEQIDNQWVKHNKLMLLFKKIKTVEKLELYLFDSITKEINNMLGSHNFNKLDKMFENLKLLTILDTNSYRIKRNFNIEEQFIYIHSPYKREEEFELRYNLYGGISKKSSGVAFHDNKNNISGLIIMPNKDTTDFDEEIDNEPKKRRL